MKSTTLISIIFTVGSLFVGADAAGPLTEKVVEEAMTAGWRYLSDLEDLERRLIENDIFVKDGTVAHKMALFKKPSPESVAISQQALRFMIATQNISQRLHLLPQDWPNERDFFTRHSANRQSCLPTPSCNATSKYRTIDGSCNNLQHPLFGQSGTSLTRFLQSDYSDGLFEPRKAVDGSDLPNARSISLQVVIDADVPVQSLTLALMQWGQFIDHDLDSVPVPTLGSGDAIACCDPNGQTLPKGLLYPPCYPIMIPEGDELFLSAGRTCMNFVRSMPGPRIDCSFGPLEQVNGVTHWLDGSQIYGSTSSQNTLLRNFTGGLLRTLYENGRHLLPLSASCNSLDCFIAGDSRATEQSMLTVMHTLWMREHNRIANQLAILRPLWNDEKVYQESRRIVIAQLQHITYNEWLPHILGPSNIQNYGLQSSSPGYFNGYNTSVNPSINNEFATAAFRMGHSLIQGRINLFAENGTVLPECYRLNSFFFNATSLRVKLPWFDNALRGLYNQQTQDADRSFTTEVTNRLFAVGSCYVGFDLVALNIQRGRDHGLPGYTRYREWCGLPTVVTFDDLNENIRPNLVEALRNVYSTVEDIDLFIGGILEEHVPGSLLGPTFNCIIANQFALLKQGDRFYYELGNQNHSFNPSQLTEIRKSTLARVICDNSDGTILSIQPQVFRMAGPTNVKTSCLSLPRVNLTLFI